MGDLSVPSSKDAGVDPASDLDLTADWVDSFEDREASDTQVIRAAKVLERARRQWRAHAFEGRTNLRDQAAEEEAELEDQFDQARRNRIDGILKILLVVMIFVALALGTVLVQRASEHFEQLEQVEAVPIIQTAP